MTPELKILPDAGALAKHAAAWLTEAALAKQGTFAVALSGGSTPRTLYALLAEQAYKNAFPWDRTHWFWGDERFVPQNDPLSNYHMTWTAMLSHVPAPAENIHAVPTEGLTPDAAAKAYQTTLRNFYGSDRLDVGRPLFDINLLGLGPDGHTASLFPGTDVLTEQEDWVSAVIGAKAEARITLTYPALNSSAQVAFLISGAEKQAMLERLMKGDMALPASRIDPVGRLLVFADNAAVGNP